MSAGMDAEEWLEGYCPAERRRQLEGEARFEAGTLILRHGLWIGLAALFWASGLDEQLAGALRAKFPGGGWAPWAYMGQAALAVLTYEILLFPLTYALACVRERLRGGEGGEEDEPLTLGGFVGGYLWVLGTEVLVVTAGLTLVHVLRRFLGPGWWVAMVGMWAILESDVVGLFRPTRHRQKVEDEEFLASLRDGVARMEAKNGENADGKQVSIVWKYVLGKGFGRGGLKIGGVELDSGDNDSQRAVRLVRSGGNGADAGHVFVVARTWWMALTPSARLALLLREAADWRARRFLRVVELVLMSVACAAGAWLADGISARMGWGTLAAPEAIPLVVIVFFSLALFFGCVLKFLARRVNLACDVRTAAAHPGGAAAFAEMLKELFPLTEEPPSLPRWCTLLLFEYAPMSRVIRVRRALGEEERSAR